MATLRQLYTFIAVAETQQMSIAAKITFLSQPTVSQTISILEAEYETKLFERKPRTLELTQSGELLYSHAKNLVESFEKLNESMGKPTTKKLLRIGATITVGEALIDKIVKKLAIFHGEIEPYIYVENTEKLEKKLLCNEIDVALVEGMIDNDKIYTEPIMRDELKVICSNSHPFALKSSITIDDLRNCKFVLREKGSGTRLKFENLIKEHNININPVGEFSSSLSIINYVNNSNVLSVISPLCVTKSHYENKIHTFSIDGVSLERFFHICYNKKHPMTSQCKNFINITKSLS